MVDEIKAQVEVEPGDGDAAQPVKLALTVKDVAEMLGIGRRTVWRLIATGQIPPPMRIGRSVRWRKASFERWLEKREREALREQKSGISHTGP